MLYETHHLYQILQWGDIKEKTSQSGDDWDAGLKRFFDDYRCCDDDDDLAWRKGLQIASFIIENCPLRMKEALALVTAEYWWLSRAEREWVVDVCPETAAQKKLGVVRASADQNLQMVGYFNRLTEEQSDDLSCSDPEFLMSDIISANGATIALCDEE